MTTYRVQQQWQRFKVWWDRFWGLEAPEEESDPSPEYVAGWWDGYAAGDASAGRLLGVIERLARGR